jgi:hypothetical protein
MFVCFIFHWLANKIEIKFTQVFLADNSFPDKLNIDAQDPNSLFHWQLATIQEFSVKSRTKTPSQPQVHIKQPNLRTVQKP